jgi:hypothetical protein
MESLDREVQEYQSLIMRISTEPETSKREQMESTLLQTLSSAKFLAILGKVLLDKSMRGRNRDFA